MRHPLFYALLAAVLFSTGGVGIKGATLNGLELSSARSLVAFLVLITFTRFIGRSAKGEEQTPSTNLNCTTLFAAIAYAATLVLFVQATKWTTAANAIFLQYTSPLYMLVLEPWMYKEKYRGRDFAVVVACLAGMSLFFVGQLRADDVRGNAAALASGLAFAIFSLLLRRNQTNDGGAGNLSAVVYGNLLLGLACAPWLVARVAQDGLAVGDFLIVMYLGAIQIGLAYAFYTAAIARGARSLDVGIVGYTEAVLNPLLVLLVLGERPTLYAVTGGAIIISAVVVHTLYGAHRAAREASLPRT